MLHGENIKFFHIWKVISRHTLVVYMYLKAEPAEIYRKNYKRVNQTCVSAVREAFVVIVAEVSK